MTLIDDQGHLYILTYLYINTYVYKQLINNQTFIFGDLMAVCWRFCGIDKIMKLCVLCRCSLLDPKCFT